MLPNLYPNPPAPSGGGNTFADAQAGLARLSAAGLAAADALATAETDRLRFEALYGFDPARAGQVDVLPARSPAEAIQAALTATLEVRTSAEATACAAATRRLVRELGGVVDTIQTSDGRRVERFLDPRGREVGELTWLHGGLFSGRIRPPAPRRAPPPAPSLDPWEPVRGALVALRDAAAGPWALQGAWLSLAHTCIEEHGGEIAIEFDPGGIATDGSRCPEQMRVRFRDAARQEVALAIWEGTRLVDLTLARPHPRYADPVAVAAEARAAQQRQDRTPPPSPPPRPRFADALAQHRSERQAAEERAAGLLWAALTPEQQAQYAANQTFDVWVGVRRFRVHRERSSNVIELDAYGQAITEYCVGPVGDLPLSDHLLAQLLYLRYNPKGFFAKANKWRLEPATPALTITEEVGGTRDPADYPRRHVEIQADVAQAQTALQQLSDRLVAFGQGVSEGLAEGLAAAAGAADASVAFRDGLDTARAALGAGTALPAVGVLPAVWADPLARLGQRISRVLAHGPTPAHWRRPHRRDARRAHARGPRQTRRGR